MLRCVLTFIIFTSAVHLSSGESYVGCFPAAGFTATSSATTVASCEAACAEARLPLFGMSAGRCACSAIVPSSSVSDDGCAVGDRNVAAVYYRHSDSSKGCRVAPAPLQPGVWAEEGDRKQLQYASGSDGATLALVGIAGPRLHVPNATSYGMYQARMRPCRQIGCITAFYMTSDVTNKNVDQDEIDIEFLNAHPSNGTGGIWPNTWINANETGPAQVSALLDTSVWMTYTIDWQPSGVTWYVDGSQLDFKAPPVPSKPMYTMISIWTKNHIDFGGAVTDGHEPYFSSFAGVTRVLCDLPSPRTLIMPSPSPPPLPSPTSSPSPRPAPAPHPPPPIIRVKPIRIPKSANSNTTRRSVLRSPPCPPPAPVIQALVNTAMPTRPPRPMFPPPESAAVGTGGDGSNSTITATMVTDSRASSSVQESNSTSSRGGPSPAVGSNTAAPQSSHSRVAAAAPAALLSLAVLASALLV